MAELTVPTFPTFTGVRDLDVEILLKILDEDIEAMAKLNLNLLREIEFILSDDNYWKRKIKRDFPEYKEDKGILETWRDVYQKLKAQKDFEETMVAIASPCSKDLDYRLRFIKIKDPKDYKTIINEIMKSEHNYDRILEEISQDCDFWFEFTCEWDPDPQSGLSFHQLMKKYYSEDEEKIMRAIHKSLSDPDSLTACYISTVASFKNGGSLFLDLPYENDK